MSYDEEWLMSILYINVYTVTAVPPTKEMLFFL